MTHLAKMMKLYLTVNDIEQKRLAAQLGISESSFTRLLQGKGVEMQSFAAIIKWLTEEVR